MILVSHIIRILLCREPMVLQTYGRIVTSLKKRKISEEVNDDGKEWILFKILRPKIIYEISIKNDIALDRISSYNR